MAYLTNDRGDFLKHPDKKNEFAWERKPGQRVRIQDSYSQTKVAELFDQKKSVVADVVIGEKQNRQALRILKIHFDKDRPDRFLLLGLAKTQEVLLAGADRFRDVIWFWGAVLLTGGIALALVFSQVLIRPLKQITRGTEQLVQGELDVPLPTNRNDEIGILARSFQSMANEVQHQRESLELRVKERTATLQQRTEELAAAKEATDAAMKAQSIFLDNVAHDLRTPLTVVIGYSEDLLRRAVKDDHQKLVPDLQLVVNRGQDLLELINDLLTLSKAMNGNQFPLDLRTFDVTEMIRSRTEGIGLLAKRNRNKIVVDCPDAAGTMVSDEVRLWRILMNLLTNACKFTQKGQIKLSVMRDGEWFVFRVSDTGKGIKSEDLQRLFHRFEQVQSGSTSLGGGVGLGLSICALYCNALGGEIGVESELGKGSTFTVRLPVVAKGTMTTMSDLVSARGQTPRRGDSVHLTAAARPSEANLVLIIEDDASLSELVQRNLNEEGVFWRIAATGEEGLRLAKELIPSAIILDVVLPGIDGWAVLAALKTDPSTVDIPVIMASMLDEQTRGLTMGADEYLTKPFKRDRIVDLIHKHVHNGKKRVLIVEDDADLRRRLARILNEQGWDVVEAEDGSKAMHEISLQPPALILLDLLLPVMDGFAVIEAIRAHPEWRLIPVVVITHVDLDGDTRKRLQGQVNEILSKELYSRDDLLRKVRELIRESEQSRARDAINV